jgi:prophage DNA circulation protein
MSWKDSLQDARFRNVTFEVLRIRDTGSHAVQEHKYPYRDGAEQEDMGTDAQRISLTGVFYGPQYETGLNALRAALREHGKGELMHPVFGPVDVVVLTWDCSFDGERPDYAEVQMEFAEAGRDMPFFAAGAQGHRARAQAADISVQSATRTAAEQSGASLSRWLVTVARNVSPAQRLAVLNILQGALQDYAGGVRSVHDAASYFDLPSAYLADMEAAQQLLADPVRSLGLQGLGYRNWQRLSRLFPARTLSGGTRPYSDSVGSYAGTITTGPSSGLPESSPGIFLPPVPPSDGADLLAGLPDLPADPPAESQTDVAAQTQAHVAVHANIAQTEIVASQATAMLVAEADTPAMTPHEIEALTGNTRTRLQDCITQARTVLSPPDGYAAAQALRTAALAVQQAAAAVINQRPPLVAHTVSAPCNLHLLAHRLYGDHTRAAELARLNPAIRNPNFIARGEVLHVYAL